MLSNVQTFMSFYNDLQYSFLSDNFIPLKQKLMYIYYHGFKQILVNDLNCEGTFGYWKMDRSQCFRNNFINEILYCLRFIKTVDMTSKYPHKVSLNTHTVLGVMYLSSLPILFLATLVLKYW